MRVRPECCLFPVGPAQRHRFRLHLRLSPCGAGTPQSRISLGVCSVQQAVAGGSLHDCTGGLWAAKPAVSGPAGPMLPYIGRLSRPAGRCVRRDGPILPGNPQAGRLGLRRRRRERPHRPAIAGRFRPPRRGGAPGHPRGSLQPCAPRELTVRNGPRHLSEGEDLLLLMRQHMKCCYTRGTPGLGTGRIEPSQAAISAGTNRSSEFRIPSQVTCLPV